MPIPISELTEYSDRACFFNYNFFHRHLDYDWLKPYVLLYDYIVLESRRTLEFPVDFRNLNLWEWLDSNCIFLEDYTEYKTHVEMKDFGFQKLAEVAIKKNTRSTRLFEWEYNKNFLMTFSRKMAQRKGGWSDESFKFEYLPLNPEYWKRPRMFSHQFNTIITNELLDTYKSGHVLYATGIPSVLDNLGSWLLTKVFRRQAESPQLIDSFKQIVIRHIPNFSSISWADIIQLRENRYRKRCLKLLRQASTFNRSTEDAIQVALWRLATEVSTESSIGKAVFKGVAGNIPFLPANPFSLVYAGVDVKTAKRKLDSYGWLFFLSELQNAAAKSRHKADPSDPA